MIKPPAKIYLKRVALLALFILVFYSITGAAKKPGRLELIHANVSRGVVENGIALRVLEGNVHARQDTLELFCDRAVYNEKDPLWIRVCEDFS